MHGIVLTQKPDDWQIFQQVEGKAGVCIKGKYKVIKDAIDVGVVSVHPIVRVVREDDNYMIIPWHEVETEERFLSMRENLKQLYIFLKVGYTE